jgi:hypothetical protein
MLRLLLFFPLAVFASPDLHDGKSPRYQDLEGEFSSGKVSLKTPSPNITQAYFANDPDRSPLPVLFNPDATEVTLEIPEGMRSQSGPVRLELAEKSVSFPDGHLVFSALDSRVEGPGKAKLESHPGNHRVGFWSNLDDAVVWDFQPTTWGMYWVDVTYSLAGKGSEVEVSLAGESVKGSLSPTGTWYRYTTRTLGRVYLADDRKAVKLSVKGTKKLGGAVMNLKAITLRPAPEGDNPVAKAGEDKVITLTAKEATVYGQKLRYEPQPKKLCIGYWTIPTDFVTWDLEVPADGGFKVIVYQGCTDENAGSPVNLVLGDQNITFKVKATGHFQKFEPVEAGGLSLTKGRHRLEVRPQGKVKLAVMDIQKIVLRPLAD